MHSSLEPQNYSVSDLMVALIWPLQRREDAVKTKRKESLYRIFYRRNVQFSRLQRLPVSSVLYLSSVIFTLFPQAIKADIFVILALWVKLNALSMLLPFWPRQGYLKHNDKRSPLSHQPVDVYGVLKASPSVGGIFMGYKSDILAAQDEVSPLTSD